jgi:hypothetical protein
MLFLAVLMNQNVENSKRYLCDSLYVFSCYCCSRTRATLSSSLHFRELQPGMFLRLGTVATPLAPLQHHDRQHIRQLPDYGITHTQGTVNRRQCNEKQNNARINVGSRGFGCVASVIRHLTLAFRMLAIRQTSLRHPRAARPCSCTTEQPHIMPQLLLFV